MALPPAVFGGIAAEASLSYIPADQTLVTSNYDLGAQSECVLGNGRNAPAGTTNFGFSDCSYLPNNAQLLKQTTTSQY